MPPAQIVILGGGFAGLWAALSAARELEDLGVTSQQVNVVLVNRDEWHAIRVRNYETDISDARVPLASVLRPAGVELVVGNVTGIDVARRQIALVRDSRATSIGYDQLVLASGSQLNRPSMPGLAEHAFAIDTWNEAAALGTHLCALAAGPKSPEAATVLIVGGGLTGIELACEMPERFRSLGLDQPRVILADRNTSIGSDMGGYALPVIDRALSELGVESLAGVEIELIDERGAITADGRRIDARTVVWTAGMRASPLAATLKVPLDGLGRIPVDTCLRVTGVESVFAAGDIAAAPTADGHTTVMSCQHGRPMGRYAGHNAVRSAVGRELLPMSIDYYVTCMDLGPWGAIYTKGWDRQVVAAGPDVKSTKMTTNRVRIYPPPGFSRKDLFDAASPLIQRAPAISQNQ